MPELPEVETVRQGITPHLEQKIIQQVIIRRHDLRWPVDVALADKLQQQTIEKIDRRGKYLLFNLANCSGQLIIHLGMSGTLHLYTDKISPKKHDHVDIITPPFTLRFNDPRRFGAVLWNANPYQHPLIQNLGPEPTQSQDYHTDYLYRISRKKKLTVKNFLMDQKNIAGIGNIYASEILFAAHILPSRRTDSLQYNECTQLVNASKAILNDAIEQGGTTLKDFKNNEGNPGYFQQSLAVYGRNKQPCIHCKQDIIKIVQNNRASYFCSHCQK